MGRRLRGTLKLESAIAPRCLYTERGLICWMNTLVVLICIALFCCCVYVFMLFGDGQNMANMFYTTWVGLAVVSGILIVFAIIGAIGGKKVRLELLLWNFWGTIIFLGPLVTFAVMSWCGQTYLKIWMWHHWPSPDLSSFRERFCEDAAKCLVPIGGGANFTSEAAWCARWHGNATDCGEIKAAAWGAAGALAARWSGPALGALAGGAALGLAAAAALVVRLVTASVVVRSLFDLVAVVQALPAGACLAFGVVIAKRDDLQLEVMATSDLLVANGALALAGGVFGLAAGWWKDRRALAGHLALVLGALVCLAVSFGVTLVYLYQNQEKYPNKTAEELSVIACKGKLYGCSGCDREPVSCPEWTAEEIMETVNLDLILVALALAVAAAFNAAALGASFSLWRHLKGYRSDAI